GLLALAGVLEVGKAHLAHGRLGSGGRAIFAYPGLVRRFPNTSPTFLRSKPGIALGMLLVIVLFYLAREHYGHMLGLLPYMIL
ncbi:DUF2933 domain-containing protein, partial [Klebsiella pneumoniae]|uniref:DUF2933 domain-containing protein n=1 Tax=Klebsiella pneumoniae TaxID=573 RepID=UPI002ADFB022